MSKMFDFLSELLTNIEELQVSINRMRETVKRKIQESQANERRVHASRRVFLGDVPRPSSPHKHAEPCSL